MFAKWRTCNVSSMCPEKPSKKTKSFAATLGMSWICEVSPWLLLKETLVTSFHPILGTMKSNNFLPATEH